LPPLAFRFRVFGFVGLSLGAIVPEVGMPCFSRAAALTVEVRLEMEGRREVCRDTWEEEIAEYNAARTAWVVTSFG